MNNIDRLISEQNVINAVSEWLYDKTRKESIEDVVKAIPSADKYEYHTGHTDCVCYGSDSGCPVTCGQYRDGWNDAMEYIYKSGKGYQPYTRE